MKLSTKLYGAVGTLALIGGFVGGAGNWYLVAMREELGVATNQTAVKLDLINAQSEALKHVVGQLSAMVGRAGAAA